MHPSLHLSRASPTSPRISHDRFAAEHIEHQLDLLAWERRVVLETLKGKVLELYPASRVQVFEGPFHDNRRVVKARTHGSQVNIIECDWMLTLLAQAAMALKRGEWI